MGKKHSKEENRVFAFEEKLEDKKELKILFLGTSGTGKTTLFNQLCRLEGKKMAHRVIEDREEYLKDLEEYCFTDDKRLTSSYYMAYMNKSDLKDPCRMYARTTGIREFEIEYPFCKARFVDVGGQRSERKMWAHCFEDVDLLVFFVSLASLNCSLYEYESVLELDESTKLVQDISGCKWFPRTEFLLLLTGKDLVDYEILDSLLPATKKKKSLTWRLLDTLLSDKRRRVEISCLECNLLDKSDVESIRNEIPNLARGKQPDKWLKKESREGCWNLYTRKLKWNVENHKLFPNDFKERVEVFLLCLKKYDIKIPKDVVKMIIEEIAEMDV